MLIRVSAIILFFSLFAFPSFASEIEELHQGRIRGLLTKPVSSVTKETWFRVGNVETTNEVLIQMILDRDMREVYRLRALQALAYFPGRTSNQFLWQVVHDRSMKDSFKLASLISLGAAYQAEVLTDLSPFLRDESSALREGAIRGLGFIRDPRVLPILRNHLHQEKDLELRLMVEQSIRQVERAEAEEQAKREKEILEREAMLRQKSPSKSGEKR